MNLFVTDESPIKSARNLDDKRVGKLLMECCQLLSVAAKFHWEDNGYILYETTREFTSGMAWLNHPITMWIRSSRGNYDWTLQHGNALWLEYHHRFNKIHASGQRLKFLETQRDCIPGGPLLPFVNCARNLGLGVDYSHLPVPESYRQYIMERWLGDTLPVKFTNREPPEWSHEN